MVSALWTGISGLSAQQTALDNESNNIANVNTVGYKASRVSFADQMYQDSIGKGAKVEKSEKQYTQGNLNVTGNEYDVALNGDGFFVVSDTNPNGTSELYYTIAGNFRMGESGTLQDALGNEVQGWAMSPIDPNSDVVSSNSNVSSFTSDYSIVGGNQIIQHPTKIETYTAKTTDYTKTVKGDSELLSGSGIKTQSAKSSDVEALMVNYNSTLDQYALNPDGPSSPSIPQSSTIDFPDGNDNILNATGDQIYVYIDGNKITQNYVETTASTEFKAKADAQLTLAQRDLDGDGNVSDEEYNTLASREATYKALSDQISNTTGLVAYTIDTNNNPSTNLSDVINGQIKIDSIIPGSDFTLGDIAIMSGANVSNGTSQTLTFAQKGTGEAAVLSAMEALEKAVAGYQKDVFESDKVFTDDNSNAVTLTALDTLTYNIGGNSVTVTSNAGETQEELLQRLSDEINADADLSSEVQASMINGEFVVTSKKVGEDFTGNLTYTDTSAATSYLKEKNIDLSVNTGAGAEFMQIVTTIEQTSTQGSLQLKLDNLGIADSAFGEFSVDENGIIIMKQDGVEYAIGQMAIAQFNNNIGLNPVGDNLVEKTNISGEPIYNINNNNTAKIESKTLELSTADLSESLVNLMVFQRAFEANAKSITTADEILNTLINLKR